MERRFILAKAGSTLREAISCEDVDDLRAIVVERKGRIVGLIPPRSGLWRESVSNANRPVDDFVEKTLVICRDVDLLSVVLALSSAIGPAPPSSFTERGGFERATSSA